MSETAVAEHLLTERRPLGAHWDKLMMWLFLGSDAMGFARGKAHLGQTQVRLDARGELVESERPLELDQARGSGSRNRQTLERVNVEGRLLIGMRGADRFYRGGQGRLRADHLEPDLGHALEPSGISDGGIRAFVAEEGAFAR